VKKQGISVEAEEAEAEEAEEAEAEEAEEEAEEEEEEEEEEEDRPFRPPPFLCLRRQITWRAWAKATMPSWRACNAASLPLTLIPARTAMAVEVSSTAPAMASLHTLPSRRPITITNISSSINSSFINISITSIIIIIFRL
jgi:hypothetical protein